MPLEFKIIKTIINDDKLISKVILKNNTDKYIGDIFAKAIIYDENKNPIGSDLTFLFILVPPKGEKEKTLEFDELDTSNIKSYDLTTSGFRYFL